MNFMNELLDEVTLATKMVSGFTAIKQGFNPKAMVYAVAFTLNVKGMELIQSLMSQETLAGTDELFSEEIRVIDLEKKYFQRPDYVNQFVKDYDELINKWMLDRTEKNTNAMVEYMDRNHDKSLSSWRLKVIGSVNDIVVVEEGSSANEGEYRVLAVASENIPIQWLSAFIRDAGNGNSVAWYGANSFGTNYGLAFATKEEAFCMKLGIDVLTTVMRAITDTSRPEDTDKLTISQIRSMESAVEKCISVLSTRGHWHQTTPTYTEVDEWITELGNVGLTTGEDFWQVTLLIDKIINRIAYSSQYDRLVKAGEALESRIKQHVKTIYEREMEIGLETFRKNNPGVEDFTLTEEETSMWRFYVMQGESGSSALELLYQKRADSERSTDKVRKLINDIADREEAELRQYIEEAEAEALSKDVSMDYAGAMKLFEKLFDKSAKEYLEELVEKDKEDEDWKAAYLEVASMSLNPTKSHKVDRLELGAFYLWLNTTRHELKKDK